MWKRAFIYGIAAFGIGFVFGAWREVVFVPWLGEPAAHWLEFPLVTGLVCFVGYRMGRRMSFQSDTWAVGLSGVVVLLFVEGPFALGLMQQPLETFLSSFDVSRGALFPFGLAAMALAPRLGWQSR